MSVDSEDAEDPSDRAVNTSCLWQMDGSEQKCQVKEGAAFPQDKERGPCVWHVAMAFCKGGSCCRVAQEAKWLSCLFQQGFTALVGKHFIKMLKCWFIRPLLACVQNLCFRLMLFNLLQMLFFLFIKLIKNVLVLALTKIVYLISNYLFYLTFLIYTIYILLMYTIYYTLLYLVMVGTMFFERN